MTTPQAPTENGSAYYRLFEYMSRTHDLTLTDSELADICDVVEAMKAAAYTQNALFAKCVEYKLMKDGMVEIHCKNGLWSVAGRDRKLVEREAAHYWQQYYADGEYNSILANVKGEPR
jgi:hypothetical protein